MSEEIFSTVKPDGTTWRCVKSQLWKHGGEDPFTPGRIVYPEMVAAAPSLPPAVPTPP